MTMAGTFLSLSNLAPGTCLCCLYQTHIERWRLLGPYLLAGLKRGERVLVIAGSQTADSILALLSQDDASVHKALDNDQLLVVDPDEALIVNDRLDADKLIAFLRREADTALTEGYRAVRIALELTDALTGPDLADQFVALENRLETLSPGRHCQVLCLCDQERVDPSFLAHVLDQQPHPQARLPEDTMTETQTRPDGTHPDDRPNEADGTASIHTGGHEGHAVMLDRPITPVSPGEQIDRAQRSEQANRHDTELDRTSDLLLSSAVEYGMFTLDAQGHIATWNASAQRHFGYDQEDILGRHLSCIYGSDEIQAHQPEVDLQAATRQGQHHAEGWRHRKDGSRFWASTVLMALRDDDGLSGYAVVLRDLSDRKDAQQKRHARESKARHARKLEALGAMARDMAHDFNNLLTGILGNASIALMDLPEESTLRAQMEMIETAAKRAAELTHQMLAYARSGETVAEPLDISTLLREWSHAFQASLGQEVTLSFDSGNHVPSVSGDADQLKLVIKELVVRVADGSTPPSRINLRTRRIWANRQMLDKTYFEEELPEGPYVCLEIAANQGERSASDTETDHDRVQGFGRGIGLSRVLHIVEEHGGTLGVMGDFGHVAGFSILLPCLEDDAGEDESDRHDQALDEDLVLIVDDEESVIRVAEMSLQRAGLKTLSARDGAEAVRLFQENNDRIKLVVLDLTMPGMDGMEAFDHIRTIRPDARIVLSSGYSEKEVTKHFTGKALAGFIQKPYLPAHLIEQVQGILAERHHRTTSGTP